MAQVIDRREVSRLDVPLLSIVQANWETLLYGLMIVVAILTRFWDLGSRGMSHDESLHTQYSWQLYVGKGYEHNPMMHGPFKFHLTALIYFIFGASDYTSRMGPALFGVVLVALPFLLRKYLGRYGALVTSFLFLISPSIMYHGRYIRDEIFMLVWWMLMIVALFRWLDDREERWVILGVTALTFSITTMEVSYIHGFIGLTFILAALAAEFVKRGEAPFLEAIKSIPLRTILISLGLFTVIYTLLYTTFFTNPKGVLGIPESIGYWLRQQPVQRGSQPWYYYLLLLPLYEFTPLFFGLVATVVYPFSPRLRLKQAGDTLAGRLFVPFLLYQWILAFAIFSWAGEKMPWLTVYMAMPLAMIAGRFVGDVLESADWHAIRERGGFVLGVLLVPTLITLLIWIGLRPFRGMSLQRLGETMQWLASLAVLVLLAGTVVQYVLRMTPRRAGYVVFAVVFGLFSLFTIRAAWMVSFINQEWTKEMLFYAHASPDVKLVVAEIEDLSERLGQYKDMKIAYDNAVPWPMEWYFRDYRNKQFFNDQPAGPLDAPVVLVGTQNEEKTKPALANQYVRRQYRLIWWPNEDYKQLQTNASDPFSFFSGVATALSNPALRESALKIWLWRDYGKPLDAWPDARFAMYVRKDVVGKIWSYGAAAPDLATTQDEYEKRRVVVAAVGTFGTQGAGTGQLLNPKGTAIDSRGNIYVVDSGNHRIVKFDPKGAFVTQWGTNGSGPGQFKDDPWGVAVDAQGNVYVADTWNHRIQKFDGSGAFITQWGTFTDTGGTATDRGGQFWGPRAIAFDSEGNLYVTDTGNKRVQKFAPDGQFLGQWGGAGFQPGQFNEPVGIAISPKTGDIFIADTWNRRIQRFDENFKPIAQWTVQGWAGESVNNKPYLAVDANDNVYVTDPEGYQVIKFDNQGRVQAVLGQFGTDQRSFNLPTGIAIGPEGHVFVADSFNHRVMKFEAVK